MRFDTIHIPAFGPFTDFSRDFVKNGHDIHLVYGANEAGKSSLLRGIHQMFYGIPVQSKDNFVHDNSKLRVGGTVSNDTQKLSFLRKKGRSNTLLDTRGNTIDDAELEAFLGTVNGEFFDSMFGLDTQSLRDGAGALLSGEGDLGTQLFSASLGGTPIEAAITKLETEADSLYKGSGSKNKTILPALKAYKEGEKLATLAPPRSPPGTHFLKTSSLLKPHSTAPTTASARTARARSSSATSPAPYLPTASSSSSARNSWKTQPRKSARISSHASAARSLSKKTSVVVCRSSSR